MASTRTLKNQPCHGVRHNWDCLVRRVRTLPGWMERRHQLSSDCVAVEEYHVRTCASTMNRDNIMLHEELATIIRPFYERQRPVIVRGAVESAPATTRWTSFAYWQQWLKENDDTMVAVEMGGSYTSEVSARAEIPFSHYLQYLELFEERYGRTGQLLTDKDTKTCSSTITSSWSIPSSELVYMAQNDLPQPLLKDVFVPSFCQTDKSDQSKVDGAQEGENNKSVAVGLGRLYSIMLWLGPRGCVSPLHFDPLDNCLMQHMGRKRVLLYEPTLSSSSLGWHYAGHNGLQKNTSPINPEVLDYAKYGDDDQVLELQWAKDKYPLFLEKRPNASSAFSTQGICSTFLRSGGIRCGRLTLQPVSTFGGDEVVI